MGSPRETFLKQFENWELNIALGSQWVLMISGFPDSVINQVGSHEAIIQNGSDWLISGADYNLVTSQGVQNTAEMGCFFIDSVVIPGEGYNSDEVSSQNSNGFISSAVVGKRSSFTGKRLVTNFRETNSDFVELVIRPWIIMAGYRGYFAYPNESDRVRTNSIQLINYSRYQAGQRRIRKIYTFYNVAPIEVDGRTYNYSEDMGPPTTRSVGWTFDNYSIQP